MGYIPTPIDEQYIAASDRQTVTPEQVLELIRQRAR